MKHLVMAATLLLVLGLVACSKQAPKPKAPELKARSTAPNESIAPAPAQASQTAPAKPVDIHQITQAPPVMKFTGTPYLTIKVKDYGTIKIKLDPQAAPLNASNVYQLAQGGFYNGLIFHRIIKGFMMQGGDPTGTGTGGPNYTVPAEIKLLNKRGAVAMARTNNPEKASSSCQFYIIFKDAPFLDQTGYTVIGNVVSGMDVVDKIENVPVQMGHDGAPSAPITPVVMESVTASQE